MAPVLTLPANITAEATSASGAAVSFIVTATDAVDPSPTVLCSPASGATFGLGTTTVSCTATDASLNSSSGTFTVTWAGNTPIGNPVVSLPPVTLTFTNVTQAGHTTLTTSGNGPPPSFGFKLGVPPTYFVLTITAVFDSVEVCIDYSGIVFGSEPGLTLRHRVNNQWVDVTASLDTTSNIICGSVTSFSAFTIFEPEDITPPVITITSPAEFGVETVGTTIQFSATDDLSGLASLSASLSDTSTTTTVTSGFAPGPGVYTLTVTATDLANNEATETRQFVIYDPSAGFATGGGWIIRGGWIIPGGSTSDAGDDLPGLDNASKATFGFVVKYKKGATTPTGQLEFRYRVGDFDLHSTHYDWLVVTNKNWAKFQGIATIKGIQGVFPFKVDGRDGDANATSLPDRFVIKIWAAGANPDTDEPIYKASGDLGGGQIKIHDK